MITRIVKMEFREEEVENFKKLIQPFQDEIKKFEGCQSVTIMNDKNVPTRFFSYSTWLTEDHLDAYRNSELFKTTWAKAKSMFATNAQAWTVEDAF